MRILGMDPSLRSTGWVIVEDRNVIGWGVIRTRGDLPESLALIRNELRRIIEDYRPERAAVEAVIYHKNPKVAITLGAVRGVILLTLHDAGVPVHEFSPTRLKLSSTRTGSASKHQVAYILRNLYNLDENVPDHVSDALAAANYLMEIM